MVTQLRDYSGIDELFVVGPKELDNLFRIGTNPLSLKAGWVPEIEVSDELDSWIHSCVWRDNENWKTRAALVLAPPEIGDIPTSLIGQNQLLGVAHDGVAPGIIRQDVFWSNYFVQPNYDWANELAVDEWQWLFIYEHPPWTTKINWDRQQEEAKKKGMPISTAAQDALCLNLVLAATGTRFRLTTWSRTATICGGYPLDVLSGGTGVYVSQDWNPGHAFDSIAASVQGVPAPGY